MGGLRLALCSGQASARLADAMRRRDEDAGSWKLEAGSWKREAGVTMIEQHYLDDALRQLRKLKTQADQALAQTTDEHLFATLDPESNSIAVIMKHMAGNMRSRWTDFLTTDGEKPDRERDAEFEVAPADTREHVMSQWEGAWVTVFATISSLTPIDLASTVRIRGEAHSVVEAINRQTSHYAAHVGQIVLLAKHYAGARWKTLSIPRGRSKEVDVSKSGGTYRV
jgi:hypothetical protein